VAGKELWGTAARGNDSLFLGRSSKECEKGEGLWRAGTIIGFDQGLSVSQLRKSCLDGAFAGWEGTV